MPIELSQQVDAVLAEQERVRSQIAAQLAAQQADRDRIKKLQVKRLAAFAKRTQEIKKEAQNA